MKTKRIEELRKCGYFHRCDLNECLDEIEILHTSVWMFRKDRDNERKSKDKLRNKLNKAKAALQVYASKKNLDSDLAVQILKELEIL